MKKFLLAVFALAVVFSHPSTAMAHDHHDHWEGGPHFSFTFGSGYYGYPRYYGYPGYYAPYYAYAPPPPVVYAPLPQVVYAQPATIVTPTPQTVVFPSSESSAMPANATSETYIDDNGRTCREYQSTAKINGHIRNTYGTACLQPDGAWRVVQ